MKKAINIKNTAELPTDIELCYLIKNHPELGDGIYTGEIAELKQVAIGDTLPDKLESNK